MQKTKFFKRPVFLIFIIVAIIISILILLKNPKSTFKKSDIKFNIEDTKGVNHIIIESAENKAELLLKNNLGWYTSSDKEANNPLIVFVLETLKNIQMEYMVASKNKDTYADSVNNYGTSISLYIDNKKIYQLKFYELNNKTITLNRKDVPYVISVKGKRDLSLKKLIVADEIKWTNHLLIDLTPDEISKVIVKYGSYNKKDFGLSKNDSSIIISDLTGKTYNKILEENINDYLFFFRGITYYIPNRDILTGNFSDNLFTISILTASEKAIQIKAYPLINNATKEKDINFYTGIVNNADTVYLKYIDFDPILVDRDYFLKN